MYQTDLKDMEEAASMVPGRRLEGGNHVRRVVSHEAVNLIRYIIHGQLLCDLKVFRIYLLGLENEYNAHRRVLESLLDRQTILCQLLKCR